MTLEDLKTKHPDIYSEAVAVGKAEGRIEGKKDGAEALEAEMLKAEAKGKEIEGQRIKDVEAQSMPGHEALIAELKFDGKTTGPEAAVKVLTAEKEATKKKDSDLDADAKSAIVSASAGDDTGDIEGKDFDALVEACMKEKEVSKGKAISIIAKSHPEAHEAWVAKTNKDKEGAHV